MWVWLKLKPTPKGDFCVVRAKACFVNFSMHSTRRQNNIIPFHPKCPKWDQNLQFTPQSETTSFSVTFIRELPPRGRRSPGHSYFTYLWNDPCVQTFHSVSITVIPKWVHARVKLRQATWPWYSNIRLMNWWQMAWSRFKTATAMRKIANTIVKYRQWHGLLFSVGGSQKIQTPLPC